MKYVIRINSMCNYLHNDISMYSLSELLKEYIDNENVKRAIALCKWRPYKDYLTVKWSSYKVSELCFTMLIFISLNSKHILLKLLARQYLNRTGNVSKQYSMSCIYHLFTM